MSKNELVVLGLLNEMPMHGYQLYHEIEKRNMESWAQVNLASVYNTLDRLRRAEMVEAKKEKPGKMPEREVFHITRKGRQKLSSLVEEAITDDRMPENNFCVGVAFLFGLSKKKALECLETKKKRLKKVAKHLESLRKDPDQDLPLNWRFLLGYGIDHLRLDVKRIEDLRRKVFKLKSWS
ncbi:MAG: helix-turn-helix transcriptional regulator [candidate division Zixibacteria bacterium]|nr:helix-turn-helix transcriptional regulator [candidate division Zixibacteria bacterium]